jgi:glutathione peroxidase
MKFLLLLMTLSLFADPAIYDFNVTSIDGKSFDFSQYKGKKILIVNTASECGYTYQYENLEKLYQNYKDKLVVIAFPANNFGEQEPGSNEQIKDFCMKTYNIKFPIMTKVSVKGDDMAPIFKWLTTASNPDFTGDIKWNFEKFLIDENGKLIHRFRHKVEPLSEEITKAIEAQ